jgi:DNA-binding MarR family transcriptional regulator
VLTEEGQRLAQELETRREELFEHAFGQLSAQRQALLAELFDDFVSAAENVATDGAPASGTPPRDR